MKRFQLPLLSGSPDGSHLALTNGCSVGQPGALPARIRAWACRPTALLLAGAAFIAGCGGGDGQDDPPVPPSDNTRRAMASFDHDNNGIADASGQYRYDGSGRLVEFRYTYTGDSVADRFAGRGEGNTTDTISYNSQGKVASLGIDGEEGSGVLRFEYGGGAVPTGAELTSGGISGQERYIWNSTGQMTRREVLFSGSVFGVNVYTYDTQGRRILDEESGPGGEGAVQTRYTWNTDGTLASAEGDFDEDGEPFRYEMTYEAGRQTGTRKTSGGRLQYVVRFVYDAQSRLERAVFDVGGDGTDDATMTLTWESGPCQPFTYPVFDPLIDTVTGEGATPGGSVSTCQN